MKLVVEYMTGEQTLSAFVVDVEELDLLSERNREGEMSARYHKQLNLRGIGVQWRNAQGVASATASSSSSFQTILHSSVTANCIISQKNAEEQGVAASGGAGSPKIELTIGLDNTALHLSPEVISELFFLVRKVLLYYERAERLVRGDYDFSQFRSKHLPSVSKEIAYSLRSRRAEWNLSNVLGVIRTGHRYRQCLSDYVEGVLACDEKAISCNMKELLELERKLAYPTIAAMREVVFSRFAGRKLQEGGSALKSFFTKTFDVGDHDIGDDADVYISGFRMKIPLAAIEDKLDTVLLSLASPLSDWSRVGLQAHVLVGSSSIHVSSGSSGRALTLTADDIHLKAARAPGGASNVELVVTSCRCTLEGSSYPAIVEKRGEQDLFALELRQEPQDEDLGEISVWLCPTAIQLFPDMIQFVDVFFRSLGDVFQLVLSPRSVLEASRSIRRGFFSAVSSSGQLVAEACARKRLKVKRAEVNLPDVSLSSAQDRSCLSLRGGVVLVENVGAANTEDGMGYKFVCRGFSLQAAERGGGGKVGESAHREAQQQLHALLNPLDAELQVSLSSHNNASCTVCADLRPLHLFITNRHLSIVKSALTDYSFLASSAHTTLQSRHFRDTVTSLRKELRSGEDRGSWAEWLWLRQGQAPQLSAMNLRVQLRSSELNVHLAVNNDNLNINNSLMLKLVDSKYSVQTSEQGAEINVSLSHLAVNGAQGNKCTDATDSIIFAGGDTSQPLVLLSVKSAMSLPRLHHSVSLGMAPVKFVLTELLCDCVRGWTESMREMLGDNRYVSRLQGLGDVWREGADTDMATVQCPPPHPPPPPHHHHHHSRLNLSDISHEISVDVQLQSLLLVLPQQETAKTRMELEFTGCRVAVLADTREAKFSCAVSVLPSFVHLAMEGARRQLVSVGGQGEEETSCKFDRLSAVDVKVVHERSGGGKCRMSVEVTCGHLVCKLADSDVTAIVQSGLELADKLLFLHDGIVSLLRSLDDGNKLSDIISAYQQEIQLKLWHWGSDLLQTFSSLEIVLAVPSVVLLLERVKDDEDSCHHNHWTEQADMSIRGALLCCTASRCSVMVEALTLNFAELCVEERCGASLLKFSPVCTRTHVPEEVAALLASREILAAPSSDLILTLSWGLSQDAPGNDNVISSTELDISFAMGDVHARISIGPLRLLLETVGSILRDVHRQSEEEGAGGRQASRSALSLLSYLQLLDPSPAAPLQFLEDQRRRIFDRTAEVSCEDRKWWIRGTNFRLCPLAVSVRFCMDLMHPAPERVLLSMEVSCQFQSCMHEDGNSEQGSCEKKFKLEAKNVLLRSDVLNNHLRALTSNNIFQDISFLVVSTESKRSHDISMKVESERSDAINVRVGRDDIVLCSEIVFLVTGCLSLRGAEANDVGCRNTQLCPCRRLPPLPAQTQMECSSWTC
eukprot:768578-Hanusia_phi.AAC.3